MNNFSIDSNSRSILLGIIYDIGIFIPFLFISIVNLFEPELDDVYIAFLALTILFVMLGPLILNIYVKKYKIDKTYFDFNIDDINTDLIRFIDKNNFELKKTNMSRLDKILESLFSFSNPKSILYNSGLLKLKNKNTNNTGYIYGISNENFEPLYDVANDLKYILRYKILGNIFLLLPFIIFVSLNIVSLTVKDVNKSETNNNYRETKKALTIILAIYVFLSLLSFIILRLYNFRGPLIKAINEMIKKEDTYYFILILVGAFFHIQMGLYDLDDIFTIDRFKKTKKKLSDFLDHDLHSRIINIIKNKKDKLNNDKLVFINNKHYLEEEYSNKNCNFNNIDANDVSDCKLLISSKIANIINSYNYHLFDLFYEDSVLSKFNLLGKSYFIFKMKYNEINEDNNNINKNWKQMKCFIIGSFIYVISKLLILIILFRSIIVISEKYKIFLTISVSLLSIYLLILFLFWLLKQRNKNMSFKNILYNNFTVICFVIILNLGIIIFFSMFFF